MIEQKIKCFFTKVLGKQLELYNVIPHKAKWGCYVTQKSVLFKKKIIIIVII